MRNGSPLVARNRNWVLSWLLHCKNALSFVHVGSLFLSLSLPLPALRSELDPHCFSTWVLLWDYLRCSNHGACETTSCIITWPGASTNAQMNADNQHTWHIWCNRRQYLHLIAGGTPHVPRMFRQRTGEFKLESANCMLWIWWETMAKLRRTICWMVCEHRSTCDSLILTMWRNLLRLRLQWPRCFLQGWIQGRRKCEFQNFIPAVL